MVFQSAKKKKYKSFSAAVYKCGVLELSEMFVH